MRKSLFILSLCFVSTFSNATEQSELDQAIRQLQSAKVALERANKATQNIRVQERVYFDYVKAHQEIDLIIRGIKQYSNGNRAQPRDPRQVKTLTGEYDKVRAR
ncbi:RAQPRD family integrative conjugative element protein [Mannheimia haemolytica]|uniref:integrative conjugative element protein, RAQPRD family n=1 Tax=Mannheimia haemolytica TaxID=75985 RepID=UPI0039FCC2CA